MHPRIGRRALSTFQRDERYNAEELVTRITNSKIKLTLLLLLLWLLCRELDAAFLRGGEERRIMRDDGGGDGF
jgi:hypothetical protein